MRRLCSTQAAKQHDFLDEVAQGFGLVEEFSRVVVSGFCERKGEEQNDENGLGDENCDSSNVPRGTWTFDEHVETNNPHILEPNACAFGDVSRQSLMSVREKKQRMCKNVAND